MSTSPDPTPTKKKARRKTATKTKAKQTRQRHTSLEQALASIIGRAVIQPFLEQVVAKAQPASRTELLAAVSRACDGDISPASLNRWLDTLGITFHTQATLVFASPDEQAPLESPPPSTSTVSHPIGDEEPVPPPVVENPAPAPTAMTVPAGMTPEQLQAQFGGAPLAPAMPGNPDPSGMGDLAGAI